MAHTIISIGEVLWDLLPDGEQFGGAPANFACQAALQGARVKIVSAVGDDPRGRLGTDILRRCGVDVGLMRCVSTASTGTVGVELNDRGVPSFEIHEDAAWDQLAWSAALAEDVELADAVVFGTLGQRSPMARSTIQRVIEVATVAEVVRVVDINLRAPFYDAELIRASICSANVLKLSDEEIPEVCHAADLDTQDDVEALLQGLMRFGSLDAVVLTRGADGATLMTQSGTFRQAGIPTEVVDTVGAGDAFTAAFLTGYLSDRPHNETLRTACEVAAAACVHAGAVPDLGRFD